jgi:hypothetical protein
LVCCFEQQVDLGFEGQHEVTSEFEQHAVEACSRSADSPQTQLAAGRDVTSSITTATQTLACAMIGLDARGGMALLSSMTGNMTRLWSVALFRHAGRETSGKRPGSPQMWRRGVLRKETLKDK